MIGPLNIKEIETSDAKIGTKFLESCAQSSPPIANQKPKIGLIQPLLYQKNFFSGCKLSTWALKVSLVPPFYQLLALLSG